MFLTALTNNGLTEEDRERTQTYIVRIIDHNKITTKDDLRNAVKQACMDYCMEDEGKDVLRDIGSFSWSDFLAIIADEKHCAKYGFIVLHDEDGSETMVVDIDEELISEDDYDGKFPSVYDQEAIEKIKIGLFNAGNHAIERFIGRGILPNEEDKDILDNLIDQAASQLPEDTLKEFFKEYGFWVKTRSTEENE